MSLAAVSLMDMWSAYLEIAVLMLSAFLIGYLSSLQLNTSKYKRHVKKLKKELEELQSTSARDIDVIFTEIEPKILEVIDKRERQAKPKTPTPTAIVSPMDEPLEPQVAKSQEQVANRASETYKKALEKKELNFDRFGYASSSDKDDLTKISGVGPYIEQKLNEIGIYSYDQISRFNWEDIQTVTEMIDFFPGRMERDNWVGQAESLKNY